MVNRLPLICLAVLLFVVPSLARQAQVFKKFAGTYVTGHDFGGSTLTLDADGSFSEWSGSDDGTNVFTSGTYTLSDGRLRFSTLKQTGKRRDEGQEFNLLDSRRRTEFFQRDVPVEREFMKLPLEWSGRVYLLDEEELKNFANAVNLGIEPRASLTSYSYLSPWYGSFFLRSGDEQKKVDGNPPLPEKWLPFLLSKPVTATVISIEEAKRYQFGATFTATIDKGSRDGLKVGMRLLTGGEKPSPWGGTEVISVEETTAKIRAEPVRSELKVGDKISSRYEPGAP